ncbi:MAG: LVIVD repeat-containing protein, partial [Methylobacter sp.]
DKEWEVSLVKDSVNPDHPHYNPKAARAKTIAKDNQAWGPGVAPEDRAHQNEKMTCYTCHTSWTTSCGGCHLSMQANWKTRRHHYDFEETRNFATYNPQVARDEMFQLGRHGPAKGGRIAPVRSSSALVLSVQNANREMLYIQQPPIAASGFSSQAFAPHYPHTERKTETKTCTDCHISKDNDNNAIMAQLLLQGTNFVNFIGYNAWLGTEDEITAVRVTEWDEPQAVVGSFLDKYAYPDWYRQHQQNGRVLKDAYGHDSGPAQCLQLRGEYLFVAEGENGMRVYDTANIANKGFSQRIVTAPVSPLGQSTRIASKNATCVVLPTNQPIHPQRRNLPNFGMTGDKMHELIDKTNLEQEFHPIYNYAFITDAEEGLILTDVNTLADGEPRNNFLERALTWNENGILNGARHLTIGGRYFYVAADVGIVILDMDNPLKPKVEAVIPMRDARASALQFRYLFVTDAEGLKVVDVTDPAKPRLVKNALVPFKQANRIYVARTYAYVAAGFEGLAIVDVEKPEQPKLKQKFSAGGQINDARDVVVGTTNASLFAYIADGKNGLRVLQLTSPDSQPGFYGFSPEPRPELIATHPSDSPALSLSKGLDRDRAVDETGGQIAVMGRIGSRPFTSEEMKRLYLKDKGEVWTVTDEVEKDQFKAGHEK